LNIARLATDARQNNYRHCGRHRDAGERDAVVVRVPRGEMYILDVSIRGVVDEDSKDIQALKQSGGALAKGI
jgi:hypothetical protein